MGVKHKKSSTIGKQPLPTDIAVGEIAINLADKFIYTKDELGNIIKVGDGSSPTDISGLVPKTTTVNGQALNSNITLTADMIGASSTKRATLSFNTSSVFVIGSDLPSNAIILTCTVYVTTPFNGSTPTLDIGSTLTPDIIAPNSFNDLKSLGTYRNELYLDVGTSHKSLRGSFVSSGSTAGSAKIVIEYTV